MNAEKCQLIVPKHDGEVRMNIDDNVIKSDKSV